MSKGYLSVPSSDPEKQGWFSNEKTQPVGWIGGLNQWFMTPRQREKSTRKMLRSRTRALPQETVSELFKSIPSSDHIKQYFNTYASAELASSRTDKNLAEWTRDLWKNFGVTDSRIETYWPLLNYPNKTRLAIVQGPFLHEANITTDSFHAYSGHGNVTGPIVYVNYGRLTDFQFLLARGISFQGTIALIRNGVVHSGLKVKMAQDFGCSGVVLYTDPDDTNTTAILPTFVEQASVQYTSYIVGDPLTQGYAATTENDTHRITLDQATGIPKIPSLPISWQDALPLLKTTEGYGIEADITWLGGLCDVNYYSGPSKSLVNLVNFNDYKVRPVWNVIGKIPGNIEPERAIIIGNHRDAWKSGSIDPSSGSAVMMELVRTIGILLERGWKPRRTIIIASWDAQEYGSVGSIEWIEQHQDWLKEQVVTYLNVDHAVSGRHFSAQSSPLLSQLLYEVTQEIIDPHTSQTVYDVWKADRNKTAAEQAFYFESSPQDGLIPTLLTDPLGVDSDHVGFFHHLGISSVSFGFRDENGYPHDRHWMETTGDPTFEYHQALTKIWGLLVFRLSSDIILPMHVQDYSTEIIRHMNLLTARQGCQTFPFISSAINSLASTSLHFEKKHNKWHHKLKVHKHISKKLTKHVTKANERLLQFERALLDPQGIATERPWFKHVVYGPELNTGVAQCFPGLTEAIDNANEEYLRFIEERIGQVLNNAEQALRGKYNGLAEDDDEDEDDCMI
ncbi:hypothetical protein INT47_002573 [Mucor saturninus]|uniref:Uncharacterized protein n=1 Tax=Mucor saturninus TaxID=64648 RepID=A0A8H7R5T3_9FUNG|nr:hypothetical protein INT47_002573 [Mucor saturninus]